MAMKELPSNLDKHNKVKLDKLRKVLSSLNLLSIKIMWLVDEKKC